MALAPIRGAPPGAPNPDFPIGKPRSAPAQPAATKPSDDQPQVPPPRQRGTPVEIDADGHPLTFKVIPEIPAIKRASMTIDVAATGSPSSRPLAFLQMSAVKARVFLTDLRCGRCPIAATGDEDGTLEIRYENAGSGPAFSVYKPGERCASDRYVFYLTFDMSVVVDDLLGDLGL